MPLEGDSGVGEVVILADGDVALRVGLKSDCNSELAFAPGADAKGDVGPFFRWDCTSSVLAGCGCWPAEFSRASNGLDAIALVMVETLNDFYEEIRKKFRRLID